jgi:hypothetical protein
MTDQPQEDPTLRERLTAEREDDLSYLTPSKPSELRGLSDDELFRLWRKFMFANKWPFPEQAQHEMRSRLIGSPRWQRRADRRRPLGMAPYRNAAWQPRHVKPRPQK